MFNKIDGSSMINIGGRDRKIKFTLNSLMELESYLPNRHLFKTMQDGTGLLSLSNIIIATWIGLKYQDKALTLEIVTTWVEEHLQENNFGDLHQAVVGAIGILGTIGEKSMYRNMIERAYSKAEATEGKPQEAEQENPQE